MRFLVKNLVLACALLCQIIRQVHGFWLDNGRLGFDHLFETSVYSIITSLLLIQLIKTTVFLNKIFVIGVVFCLLIPFTAIDLGVLELVEYPNRIQYDFNSDRIEIEKSILLSIIGWWSASMLVSILKNGSQRTFKNTNKQVGEKYSVKRRNFFTGYFILALFFHLLLTIKFKYYVAGVDTSLNFSGFITYFLPVDFLYPLVVYFVHEARRLKTPFQSGEISLFLFICLRMLQGWKGAIIDIALAFLVIEGRSKNWYVTSRNIFMLLIAFFIYKALSPFVSIVRFIWIGSSSVNQFSTEYGFDSLFDLRTIVETYSSSSLSLLSRVSAVDPFILSHRVVTDVGNSSFDVSDLVITVVEGLIPGKQFANMGFNQKFSVLCAGQGLEAVNEYGAGILGTGVLIGGYFGVYLYTLAFGGIYLILDIINTASQKTAFQIFYLTAIPTQVVGMIIGGGIHSFHKLIVAGLIFYAIENLLPKLTNGPHINKKI